MLRKTLFSNILAKPIYIEIFKVDQYFIITLYACLTSLWRSSGRTIKPLGTEIFVNTCALILVSC